MSLSIYGKLPSGPRLKRIQSAPNYTNKAFQNLSHTPAFAEDASFFKTMKEFLKKPAHVEPSAKLPFVKTDLQGFKPAEPAVVWFGHSSYLLHLHGKNILVDPVLSGNAAPLSFMVKAFKGADEYKPEHMPPIDILVLTHDHYDHLDYKTLLKLKPKVKTTVCTLGVGSHLEHWGFKSSLLSELYWWESTQLEGFTFTSTPGRHFSGRGLKRGQSLWGAFVLETENERLYLGGDSGYDNHFIEIGERFGAFDLAILEAGQYNKAWPHIHMMPEQTVQACVDLKARVLLPVHWGKFALAMHRWNEPIERVLKQAAQQHVPVATPQMGEPYYFKSQLPQSGWWQLD